MVPEPAPEKTRLAQLASSSKFTVSQLKISDTLSLLLLIADTGWKCKPLKMQDPIASWSATIIFTRKEMKKLDNSDYECKETKNKSENVQILT